MATLNFGTHINSVFTIEGRIGLGIGDDTNDLIITAGSATVAVEATAELESYYGIFGRLGIPNLGAVYPYVIAGYGKTKIDAKIGTVSDITSEVDTAFGIGANFNFDANIGGNLEYMNYYDKDDDEISGISFGLVYNY